MPGEPLIVGDGRVPLGAPLRRPPPPSRPMAPPRRRRRASGQARLLHRIGFLFGGTSPFAVAQYRQAGVFALLVLFATALGLAHGGAVARPLFMLAAFAGAHHYSKRSPWLLITWTLWLWTITPCVRRLIEWHSAFNNHDIILATPNVALLFMLPDILNARGLMRRGTVVAGLGIIVPILWGFIVSLFRGDVTPAAVAAADWIMPVAYYFYVVVHARSLDEFEPHFRAFLAVNSAVVVLYGLYQFKFMTPWDQLWLDNSHLVATDQITDPTQNRVFGTFNNPGFMALWCGWLLVMTVRYAAPAMYALGPLALFLLMMTGSRSVWLSTALGFAVLIAVAPPRNLVRSAFVAIFGVLVIVGLISALNPDVAEQFTDRFSSMGNLSNDTSANVRRQIWAETPGIIAKLPFGEGIGAIGRGAAMTAGGAPVTIDSGVLGAYLAFGWLFGSLYLFSLGALTMLSLIGARRCRSREAAANGSAALVIVGITPFLTVNGFAAMLLWLVLAVAGERNSRGRVTRRRVNPSAGPLGGGPAAPRRGPGTEPGVLLRRPDRLHA